MGQKERVLSLVHDGQTYNLTARDFTALDDLEIYRATGTTLMHIFGGGATLFTIAALVWRYRVAHGEPSLTYMQVAETFTYDSLESVSDEPREGGPPEAPGGTS